MPGLVSVNGETPSKWSPLYRDWFDVHSHVKQAALGDLEQVPKDGNLVGQLLERALLSDNDPAVHKVAIAKLGTIADAGEQAHVWNRVWGNYPEYRNQLLDVVPELSKDAQQTIMRSYSSHFDEADNRKLTAAKVAEMLETMQSKRVSGSSTDVASDYLKALAPMPEAARRPIFEALDPLLRD